MKRLFVLVFSGVLLLFNIGCKKETKTASTSIQGLWELRQASGMITTIYPPGNGNSIKFDGNNYVRSSNGQITQSGHYKIEQDLTVGSATCLVIPSGQYINRIIYDTNTTSQKVFIQISGNKLSFLSGCFAIDAGSSVEYERQ